MGIENEINLITIAATIQPRAATRNNLMKMK